MNEHLDSKALRRMVREVLREVLPAGLGAGAPGATQPGAERVETVSIRNDAELAAFVERLLGLCVERGTREALHSGRYRFRLHPDRGADTPGPEMARDGGSAAGRNDDAVQRFERGVLSEARVVKFAQSAQRIVVNQRVMVTPLARDKARQLGVKLERVK